MPEVIPAILAHSETDFHAHIEHAGLRAVAPVWHVDILDGSMFDASCWADPNVIGTWKNLPKLELHIMTHNPLPVIEAWHTKVSTVMRVIIHAEVARPLGAIIERAKQLGLETGLALNPETRLERIMHHLHDLDVLQIMGVHPGASARQFVGDSVLTKIRRAHSLFPNLAISVDGGVTTKTAHSMIVAGATRLVSASFLWSAAEPEKAFHELIAVLQ